MILSKYISLFMEVSLRHIVFFFVKYVTIILKKIIKI